MIQQPQNVSLSYVKKQLISTLLELLTEKSLDKITIQELCQVAHIGRASFYRNFSTKEEIIKLYLHQELTVWHQKLATGSPLSEQLFSLFSYFESKHAIYDCLHQRELTYLIKDALFEILNINVDLPKEQAYATSYVAYSIYGWIDTWFQRGMQESAQEISEMFKAQGL